MAVWRYVFTFKQILAGGTIVLSSETFEVTTNQQMNASDKAPYANLFTIISETQIS